MHVANHFQEEVSRGCVVTDSYEEAEVTASVIDSFNTNFGFGISTITSLVSGPTLQFDVCIHHPVTPTLIHYIERKMYRTV